MKTCKSQIKANTERRTGLKAGLPQALPTALPAPTPSWLCVPGLPSPAICLVNSNLPPKAYPSTASSGTVRPLRAPGSPLTALTTESHHRPLLVCVHPSPRPVPAHLPTPHPLSTGAQESIGEGTQGTGCSSSHCHPQGVRWDLPFQQNSPYLPGPARRPGAGWPHYLSDPHAHHWPGLEQYLNRGQA